MFKSYPVITKRPIETDYESIRIDEQYINRTGKTEEIDGIDYEMCEIKAGTPLWAQVLPNGYVYLFQFENDSMAV